MAMDPSPPPKSSFQDESRGALAQQLLQRIVELEDENRALRGDLVTLRCRTAALSVGER